MTALITCKKNALFLIVIFVKIKMKQAHEDADTIISSQTDASDDMEREVIERRNMEPREWQYEGIPIDIPSRRVGMEELPKRTTHTTTTIFTVLPPMDRRYRRIYNADEMATIEEYPFMAAVLVNERLWCGGVLIDRDAVLTAAHCLQLQYNNRFFREYVKMLTVRVGSSNATGGGELLRVTEIYFHPNYKPETLEFNVAVLKLHKNITLGNRERVMNTIEYSKDKVVPINRNVLFLGWGSVLGIGGTGGEILLQKVELPVYDLADCQEIYGRDLVSRNTFCAGYITEPKNVCNHDAGGPAIMDGVLVGILSFSSKRCDEVDKPAVFVNVGIVAPWLETLGEAAIKLRETSLKTYEWMNKHE